MPHRAHPNRSTRLASTAVTAFLAQALLSLPASAQCQPRWLPNDGYPGVNGSVNAHVWWDPDAQGPRTPILVIGGTFTHVLNLPASRLAAYDPATSQWEPVGGGIIGTVYALAVLPSGELAVGGDITSANGLPVSNLARWNGQFWNPVGSGVNDTVRALAVLPSGDLAIGGEFLVAGLTPVNAITIWNGSTFDDVGGGVNGVVRSLAVTPSGSLIVGGSFNGAGLIAANRIATWDGSVWTPLGSGVGTGYVNALAVLPGGDIVAGGTFPTAGGNTARRIAIWNGTAWSPLGPGLTVANSSSQGDVYSITREPSGDLLVGGYFNRAGTTVLGSLARWDGTAWHTVGGTGVASAVAPNYIGSARVLTRLPDGALFVGGSFSKAGSISLSSVATLQGSEWGRFGKGLNNAVGRFLQLPDGSIAATGGFPILSGQPASSVGRWDGVEWSGLGPANPDGVGPLSLLPDGRIVTVVYLVDPFTGPTTVRVYALNGSAWQQIGPDLMTSWTSQVYAMAVLPNGDIVAGGAEMSPDRLTSGGWVSLGGPGGGNNESVSRFAVLSSGDLVAAGTFTSPGAFITRWNGAAWWSMGPGLTGGSADMLAHPNGSVYVAGGFTTAGGIQASRVASWHPTTGWAQLGSGVSPGSANQLAVAPNGDLVVAGTFTHAGGQLANGLARWTGTLWQPITPGSADVQDMIVHPSGEILVGGSFHTQAGVLTPYFARHTSTNIPWVARHPESFTASIANPVTLSATAAVGYDNLTFQWQRETAPGSGIWSNVVDGPGGASPAGGVVSGSSGSINGGEPAMLTITGLQFSDAGAYRAVISNICGQNESDPASLQVINPCRPDMTTTALPAGAGYGTPNATLNNDDFFYYTQQFAAGNISVADLTFNAIPGAAGYGVPNGVLNNDDFFFYLAIFSAGC